MKVHIEDAAPLEKKIFFEVPGHTVSEEIDSAYRQLNRTVKIKGFRAGKVPRSILERYYKAQVEEEVFSKVISDTFGKAVEEYHLAPVATPTVLDRSYESGKDFKYTLTVEVKPEITVDGYLGLSVEKTPVALSDEEVEAELQKLREAHAQLKPLQNQRPIQEKDYAIVDFEGSLEGRALEGWQVKDHLVEVGSKTLVGGLDLELVGLHLNEEKSVTLTLPQDYSRKELAGREIKVHIKVKEIKEKILPPQDDEFAKDLGDFSSLADLRSRLRQKILEAKQAQVDEGAKERVMQILLEKHPFSLPKSLVERQIQHLVARAEIRLARQGKKLEEAGLDKEKLHDSFLPEAEKQVRSALILEKIAEKEKISVTEAELETRLEKMAASLKQRVEALKAYYQKKNLLEDLREEMIQEKTLDFLLGKANIVEAAPTP